MWIDDDGFYHDDYEGTYAHDVAGFDEETINESVEVGMSLVFSCFVPHATNAKSGKINNSIFIVVNI